MYVWKAGDRLEKISAKFGIPVCMVLRANGPETIKKLRRGSELKIPKQDYCFKYERDCDECGAKRNIPAARSHKAKKDETVYSIASQYNTTMRMLMYENGLEKNQVDVGTILEIPEAICGRSVHIVRAGESPFSIAQIYGLDWSAIAAANRLGSMELYPGQQIMIP